MFLFVVVYATISLVNHYFFRTFALDLGAYTNALYDYMNFKWNDSTVFLDQPSNLLADHFDLYLILFSPLAYILGTYTLLIVQIVFILVGGYGVYSYVLLQTSRKRMALFALMSFFCFFGIYSALGFDYHSNVIAAMLVPWLLLFVHSKQMLKAGLVFVFMIVGKENISLWLFFICLGLLWEYRKNPYQVRYLSVFSLVAIAYFYTVIHYIMPAFANGEDYRHFGFSVLGGNMFEALWFTISHPLTSIGHLFINHTGDVSNNYVKAELHLFVFLSGGFLLVFKPRYLFMLIPVYFQKMMHDEPAKWSVHGQYAIEFAPLVVIGAFAVISSIRKEKFRNILMVFVLILTVAVTVRRMDNTIFHSDTDNLRFYQAAHYHKNYYTGNVYKAFTLIPRDAVVSAQSMFVPHLALRDHIYQFPVIKDAGFVLVSEKERSYPVSPEEFQQLISSFKISDEWVVIFEKDGLLLLKRKP